MGEVALAGHATFRVSVAVILLAGVLVACATPPRSAAFDRSRDYAATEEAVWPLIVRFFATRNVPIRNIERASGLIVAESTRVDTAIVDCGFSYMDTPISRVATFNVLLQAAGEGRQRVTVSLAAYENRSAYAGGVIQLPCESTGTLETVLLNYISTELAAGK